MRPSRRFLRFLCALTFASGAALLALGLHVALSAHLHASAVALASLGGIVVLLSTLGFVGAGREKSGMLMLFFFLNFFLVTCLFVASYAAFCFQDAMESWLKHHWSDEVLDYLRSKPCCSTYEDTVTYLEHKFMTLGAIGFACIALVLASLYCVIRIVTVPIVMKNMLTVINFIFIALGAGVFAYGLTVKSRDEMTAGQEWIAIVFITVGTFIVALSVLGVIGARAKSRTLLLIYILGIGACLLALLTCAVGGFTFSGELAKTYEKHASENSSLACDIDLPGCSNCSVVPDEIVACKGVRKSSDGYWVSCSSSHHNNNSSDSTCQRGMTVLNTKENQGYEANDIAVCGKCPEWSEPDVTAYLKSTLNLLGLFAVIVSFFIVVGFAGALILRKSLAGYQTDSI
uniref:Tetraspanin n=1 Tax=Globisporangium ultimum (strain ATCC 200006 / CBS 805.95 / DAOM BR144) TaxID=431595 RepID=K3XBP0_GLOUD